MISLDNVTKSFDGTYAVRDFSISIADGEIFGLVGPNGAGKTTTIRMLTGLLRPDRGRVLMGGHDIVKEPLEAKRVFGYVPDRSFLYEKLTAREFLLFVSSIYSVPKTEVFARIDDLLGLFGIKDIEDELIEGYSQGMRQRLLFASALVHRPRVLLIDEPFVGLDPLGVRMLNGVITGLSKDGVTVFLATHNLHMAEELCNRVGFINEGTLVSVKGRDEIRGIEGGLEGMFLKISS